MPSRRDVLKAGGLLAAGGAGSVVARYGAWSPALPTPAAATWPQPRYGYANTGHNPDASPPTEAPSVAWTGEVAGGVNAIVAGAEHLYAGTDHGVYAFEYLQAYPEWDRPATGYRLAVADGVVVAAGRNRVTAFDAANGTELWRRLTDEYAYSLLVDEQTAYVGWNGRLDAYDTASGGRMWSISTSTRTYTGFDGDRLFVGGTDLSAYEPRSALRGTLGDGPTRAWKTDALRSPTLPVAAGEYTLIGSNRCYQTAACGLSAVTESGSQEYHVELGDNAGSVATDGERAYVVSMLYGESEGDYNVSDTTTLHALDVASGEELWSFQRPGWFCDPIVADGTVFVGESGGQNGEGNLHALDAATGETQWSYTDASGVNTLVAVDDALYVGTDDEGVLGMW
jgi:outer membrane protein assembly factor BamB